MARGRIYTLNEPLNCKKISRLGWLKFVVENGMLSDSRLLGVAKQMNFMAVFKVSHLFVPNLKL